MVRSLHSSAALFGMQELLRHHKGRQLQFFKFKTQILNFLLIFYMSKIYYYAMSGMYNISIEYNGRQYENNEIWIPM